MRADLVIHGGTVVNEWASVGASLAIKDGLILAIGDAAAMPDAAETIDATGRHLLPGLIDVHVHVREPGLTHKEDWGTATRAAASRDGSAAAGCSRAAGSRRSRGVPPAALRS